MVKSIDVDTSQYETLKGLVDSAKCAMDDIFCDPYSDGKTVWSTDILQGGKSIFRAHNVDVMVLQVKYPRLIPKSWFSSVEELIAFVLDGINSQLDYWMKQKELMQKIRSNSTEKKIFSTSDYVKITYEVKK